VGDDALAAVLGGAANRAVAGGEAVQVSEADERTQRLDATVDAQVRRLGFDPAELTAEDRAELRAIAARHEAEREANDRRFVEAMEAVRHWTNARARGRVPTGGDAG
jgi:hypothetical protein